MPPFSPKNASSGGQNRCPPLEAFLGLNGGIFSGRFFELTDWGRKRIGGILGAENAIGGGKKRPQSFELTDPGVHLLLADNVETNILSLHPSMLDELMGRAVCKSVNVKVPVFYT